MNPSKMLWTWQEVLDSKIEEPPALIPRLLYEMDNMIVLGDAKIGKSLFTMQLALSLSKGDYFLDSMKVTRPCKVAYVQAEGKMFETIPRGKKMSKEVGHDAMNIRWLYLPRLPMNRPNSAQVFIEMLGDFKPDVIIFDPLYKLAGGASLTQDDTANAITDNLDVIKVYYSCAIIINHHQHRPQIDKKSGQILNMKGDQSIFGSFVWRAWPDNVILFEPVPKRPIEDMVRNITCDTQRSAMVTREMCIILTHPDPLYWQLVEDMTATDHMILQLIIKNKVMKWQEMAEITGLAKSTIHKCLRNLRMQKKIKQLADAGTYGVYLD